MKLRRFVDTSLTLIRIWRRWSEFCRFRFHFIQRLLDRPVQLFVFAGKFFCRVVIDDDIRINAVAFYNPLLSLDVVSGELRSVEETAVKERQRLANSYNSAP
jgi:hypothetical protein